MLVTLAIVSCGGRSVDGSPGQSAKSCGPDGLQCHAGEVCVEEPGAEVVYRCAENPCGNDPTSCECAASLCTTFETCSLDDGAVLCSCVC